MKVERCGNIDSMFYGLWVERGAHRAHHDIPKHIETEKCVYIEKSGNKAKIISPVDTILFEGTLLEARRVFFDVEEKYHQEKDKSFGNWIFNKWRAK